MQNPTWGRPDARRVTAKMRPVHVPSRALLRAGLIALLGSILIVAFLVVTRGQRARAEAATRASSRIAPAPVAPAPAASTPRATPAAEEAVAASTDTGANDAGAPAAASARVPDGKGDIVPPRSAAGHRVFVDGAQVGEGTHSIRVDCGDHRLRIGSAGKEHRVAVPCGATIELR
jgi:hypothetical protein